MHGHRCAATRFELRSEPMSPIRRLRSLRRAELPVDTVELARFLIGKVVVRDLELVRLIGRIVETEAYPIGDAAGHAFRGKTPRNGSLFLQCGHAYVHFSYGSSILLNVSSERPGVGGGVPLRAIEPLEGSSKWRARVERQVLPTLAEVRAG